MDWNLVKEIAKKVELTDSFKPDEWQKKVLDHQGDIALRTGRQVGKSAVIGKKCTKLAIEHKGITILMIAAAQRQSSEIFQKTLKSLYKINDEVLKKEGGFIPKPKLSAKRNMDAKRLFEEKHGIFEGYPTRTECNLKNGTRILSLPTGKSGAFVRCYTVDVLIGDEAAFIPEPVWVAVKPMLATSKNMRGLGWTILLSTPFGKGGYYYDCCMDEDFLQIHVSSENCRRISRDFLLKEKQKLTKLEYAQEYLGEFVSEYNQFFSSELIKDRMTFIDWNFDSEYIKRNKYFLGMDIARYGADENAFVVVEMDSNKKLKIVRCLTTERKSLTDTVGRALKLHEQFQFAKIITDDSGVGGGVTDMLIERLGKNKILGINNAQRTTENDKNKSIMKEDLYSNALKLMETKRVEIISNLGLQASLKSMTYEYTSYSKLLIHGKKSHLSEAFVRACWCLKTQHLKLFLS